MKCCVKNIQWGVNIHWVFTTYRHIAKCLHLFYLKLSISFSFLWQHFLRYLKVLQEYCELEAGNWYILCQQENWVIKQWYNIREWARRTREGEVYLSGAVWVPIVTSWCSGLPALSMGEEVTINQSVSRVGWWSGPTQGLWLCQTMQQWSNYRGSLGALLATTFTAGSTLFTEVPWNSSGPEAFWIQALILVPSQCPGILLTIYPSPSWCKGVESIFSPSLTEAFTLFFLSQPWLICILYLNSSINGSN